MILVIALFSLYSNENHWKEYSNLFKAEKQINKPQNMQSEKQINKSKNRQSEKQVIKTLEIKTGDNLHISNDYYDTHVIFSGFINNNTIQFLAEIGQDERAGSHYGTFTYVVSPNKEINLASKLVSTNSESDEPMDKENGVFPIPLNIKILELYPQENKIKVQLVLNGQETNQ